MGSFAAGAGTQFVVTSTTSPSGGSTVPGPFTVTGGASSVVIASALRVPEGGTVELGGSGGTGTRFQAFGGTSIRVFHNGTSTIALNQFAFLADSASYYGFTSGNIGSATDLTLYRDAADTLAQRRSTNAQTFNIYNTFTDASNYERLAATWSSNVAYIRPQNAGTGSARLFVPVTGATTVASLPAAATAGAGARAFVTDATVTIFASTVVGGGANKVPVVSDGTNWLIG